MKRLLSVLALWAVLGGALFATPRIIGLSVGIDDASPVIPGLGKGPIPQVWLDDHEIYFLTMHPEYSLSIIEDGTLVYSVVFPSTTSSIILPSWLSGEYEILLRPSGCSYYFYGYIEL